MNTDGVSYLDVGDAYFRSGWESAINGYWSPLYCWLLGLGNWIVKPSSYWEFPLAHLVNFLIYVAALFSFDFFLRELINHQRTHRPPGDIDGGLPLWAWMLLGYTLFAWSSLDWIGLKMITPDMLVTVTVYVAAGLLLRIASQGRGATWLTFMALGTVLGLGYLAKAVMFPLAFVFLLVSALIVGSVRASVPRLCLALFTFLLVASPFLIALSLSKGRPTFGDSGKLAYAWYVNGTSLTPDEAAAVLNRHWQGQPAGSGTPQHPTRLIGKHPPIYEFAAPIQGTYPVWTDPSYWFEGLRVHIDAREQLRVIASRVHQYYDMFVGFPLMRILRGELSAKLLLLFVSVPLLLIVGWVLLAYHSQRRWQTLHDVSQYWFLAVPALAAMMMYSLVYVETRYIGGFAVLLYASAFAAIRLPSKEATVLSTAIFVPLSAIFLISFSLSSPPNPPPLYWQVAEGFRRIGAPAGAQVASLQYANNAHSQWARLARARIVAEIYLSNFIVEEDVFWLAPDSVKHRILQTFARAGASVVVAVKPPAGARLDGWQSIEETGYFAYFLRCPDSARCGTSKTPASADVTAEQRQGWESPPRPLGGHHRLGIADNPGVE
jgi:hypothetical protein